MPGFDERRKELVVGIIDYIQLYNTRKQAEFKAKSAMESVIGSGMLPTIIQPAAYKVRSEQST